MASITWRNGVAYAVWWVKETETINGERRSRRKQRRRSLSARNSAVAFQRLRLLERQLEAERWGERPRISFRDAAKAWVGAHFPTLRPKSALRYEWSLANLRAVLDGVEISAIGTAELIEFETRRRTEGVTTATIRRDLACLSSLLSYCVEREWIDSNPVPAYKKRRRRFGLKEGEARTRYFSHAEEARILAAANPVAADAIAFAIETGLRVEEQLSARWRQVHWGHQPTLVVDGKGGKTRQVPLTPRAMEVLVRCVRGESEDYIFAHVDGRRFWHLDKAFRGACRRARVADVRWHDLRRTCGCRLLQDRGFSMEQVRTWLGHSDLKTTQRSYAFLDVSHLVRAIVESQPRVAALDLGRTVARPRNHLCRTHW